MLMNDVPTKLHDEWIRYKYFWKNNIYSGKMVMTAPIQAMQALLNYSWMFDMLKANGQHRRITQDRSGPLLEASALAYSKTSKAVTQIFSDTFKYPERTILMENMVPPEIPWAMGLNTFVVESVARLLALMDQHGVHRYLDVAENSGLPTDSCGLNRTTMGTILAEDLPQGQAIISSNLPCDGGMTSYAKLEKMSGLPIYRLDVPYNFKDDKAMDFFAEDMRGMITFLEQHTGAKMNWDRLREICDNYNKSIEIESDTFDLLRHDPAPLTGECTWQAHYVYQNAYPGTQDAIDMFKKINDLAHTNLREGKPSFPDMRYRALLWNPPVNCYPGIWNWVEQAWGVGILMDMETYGYMEFVDTSSNEAMLKSLGKKQMWATMARHSRGPVENFFNDIWKAVEVFQADILFFAAHLGCKSSMGMVGVLRDECRKRGIKLCVFDYELMDSRVVTRQGIRDQINDYMKNVMKAEPLNPDLLVLDDSNDW